jgi:hypothetical protein
LGDRSAPLRVQRSVDCKSLWVWAA